MDFLIDLIVTIKGWCQGAVLWWWTCVLSVAVAVAGTIDAVSNRVMTTVEAFGMLVIPQSSVGALPDVMGLANYLFPLAEMFVMVVALGGIWLVANSYRLLKSWIPTLS